MGCNIYPKTSVDLQRTTRFYIPEVSALHNYLCENLKPYFNKYILDFYFLGYNAVQSVKISSGYAAIYSKPPLCKPQMLQIRARLHHLTSKNALFRSQNLHSTENSDFYILLIFSLRLQALYLRKVHTKKRACY
jgi:hypothetical protein